ncbi:MAG: hypothetical protein LKJ88_03535 [Bacilli bacterium]|jgi:hypothetical protein|nr:hypothetical protein [Bacilli bacterium]
MKRNSLKAVVLSLAIISLLGSCETSLPLISSVSENSSHNVNVSNNSLSSSIGKDSSSSLDKDRYPLIIDSGADLISEKLLDSYPAGERVVVKTYILYDADIIVHLDGQRLEMAPLDIGKYFIFQMPAHEAHLRLEVSAQRYFEAKYDYGNIVSGQATLLLDDMLPFVDLNKYSPKKPLGGDMFCLEYTGNFVVKETYPAQVDTSQLEIINVFQIPTQVIQIDEANINRYYTHQNDFVIFPDETFKTLDFYLKYFSTSLLYGTVAQGQSALPQEKDSKTSQASPDIAITPIQAFFSYDPRGNIKTPQA